MIDPPPWLDLSRWHAWQLEGVTPADAASLRPFDLLRTLAIAKRLEYERAHPQGPAFPGVFLPR